MIKAISYDNFKCFQSQKVQLKELTILTGLNGMGKSTVLQGPLLLRQSALQHLLPHKGLLLNGDLANLGISQSVLYEGAQKDEIGITLQEGAEIYQWLFRYQGPEDDVLSIIKEPTINEVPGLPKLSLFEQNFHYITAERLGPRPIYERSLYEVEKQRHIGSDGRFAVAYLESYGKEKVLSPMQHPDGIDDTLLSQVTAWLGEASPGVQLKTEPFPKLNRITLGMSFLSSPIKSDVFSSPNVGFGLSYLLPVLVAILSSQKGHLVFIENPESHLHPKGQVAIGRLFACAAAAGIQLLIETHSDHLINGIRLAVKNGIINHNNVAMHFFSRKNGESTFIYFLESPQIDKDGRIDTWPEGFLDQWEQSLDELLY